VNNLGLLLWLDAEIATSKEKAQMEFENANEKGQAFHLGRMSAFQLVQRLAQISGWDQVIPKKETALDKHLNQWDISQ
jgi:hypothetical protein